MGLTTAIGPVEWFQFRKVWQDLSRSNSIHEVKVFAFKLLEKRMTKLEYLKEIVVESWAEPLS